MYSATQAETIADSLARQAEFPFEMTYFGVGSELWREAEKGSDSAFEPVRDDFDVLLQQHVEQVLALVPAASPVEVVDLGPGTTRPVRGLMRRLAARSRLAGYRGIDLSPEMLELARLHLRDDFPDRVAGFELHRGDFTGPELAAVLPDAPGPPRLVVMAGGTLYNFPDPERVLRNVRGMMRAEDVLVLTLRIDTLVDRPPFMDEVMVGAYKPQQLVGLDRLSIDRSWYVPELGYDRARSEVFVRVRFVEPVTVRFDLDDGERVVSFAPDDTVLVWRYRYVDVVAVTDQLARCGLRARLVKPGRTGQVVLVAATA